MVSKEVSINFGLNDDYWNSFVFVNWEHYNRICQPFPFSQLVYNIHFEEYVYVLLYYYWPLLSTDLVSIYHILMNIGEYSECHCWLQYVMVWWAHVEIEHKVLNSLAFRYLYLLTSSYRDNIFINPIFYFLLWLRTWSKS